MKSILYILNFFYRIWFYILIAIATIVLIPFLFVFTIRETDYSKFYVVARVWGSIILYGMGYWPEIKRLEKLEKGKSYMFVANHSSMIDIMLMYRASKIPFVFVGKKELAKTPLFGFFYKRSSILVDRSNIRSRNAVFKEAQRRINQGNGICIFPEGGVPKNPKVVLDNFKDGAFRMAIDHEIPVVPLVFYDNKQKFPYNLSRGLASPGKLRVKIFPPVSTIGMTHQKDKKLLRDEVRELILQEIKDYQPPKT